MEFLFVCAEKLKEVFSMKHELPLTYSTPLGPGDEILCKDTRNCQEKVKKISHLKPNQLAPSIYIMKELCFFSLDQ